MRPTGRDGGLGRNARPGAVGRRTALGALAALVLAGCSPARPASTTAPPTARPQPGQEGTPNPMKDRQLLRAAGAGDLDATRSALAAGARVEARDARRRTPLVLAALDDHVDIARELVAAGADPDAQDERRDSAFLVTGVTGSVAMLEVLLAANPDFTVTNRYGGTALIPACERGHVDYVRAAVRTGIDLNHVNNLGWTALLEAVVLGDGGRPYQEIARILLRAGADAGIPDRHGVTALRHAENDGKTELASVLRSAP